VWLGANAVACLVFVFCFLFSHRWVGECVIPVLSDFLCVSFLRGLLCIVLKRPLHSFTIVDILLHNVVSHHRRTELPLLEGQNSNNHTRTPWRETYFHVGPGPLVSTHSSRICSMLSIITSALAFSFLLNALLLGYNTLLNRFKLPSGLCASKPSHGCSFSFENCCLALC